MYCNVYISTALELTLKLCQFERSQEQIALHSTFENFN